MRKLELFQSVVLERDLKPPDVSVRLSKGTFGAVVELLKRDGAAVEFFAESGQTIDVAFIPEVYVRPATDAEIEAHLSG